MGIIKCWMCQLKRRKIKLNIRFFPAYIHVLENQIWLHTKRWKCFKYTWFDSHCCSINGIWRWIFFLFSLLLPHLSSYDFIFVWRWNWSKSHFIFGTYSFFSTDLLYTHSFSAQIHAVNVYAMFVRRSTTCFMVSTFYVYLFFCVFIELMPDNKGCYIYIYIFVWSEDKTENGQKFYAMSNHHFTFSIWHFQHFPQSERGSLCSCFCRILDET